MEDGSKPPRQKSVRTYLKEERKGRKKRRKEEKRTKQAGYIDTCLRS
jgi:hypothetical protein